MIFLEPDSLQDGEAEGQGLSGKLKGSEGLMSEEKSLVSSTTVWDDEVCWYEGRNAAKAKRKDISHSHPDTTGWAGRRLVEQTRCAKRSGGNGRLAACEGLIVQQSRILKESIWRTTEATCVYDGVCLRAVQAFPVGNICLLGVRSTMAQQK